MGVGSDGQCKHSVSVDLGDCTLMFFQHQHTWRDLIRTDYKCIMLPSQCNQQHPRLANHINPSHFVERIHYVSWKTIHDNRWDDGMVQCTRCSAPMIIQVAKDMHRPTAHQQENQVAQIRLRPADQIGLRNESTFEGRPS